MTVILSLVTVSRVVVSTEAPRPRLLVWHGVAFKLIAAEVEARRARRVSALAFR